MAVLDWGASLGYRVERMGGLYRLVLLADSQKRTQVTLDTSYTLDLLWA